MPPSEDRKKSSDDPTDHRNVTLTPMIQKDMVKNRSKKMCDVDIDDDDDTSILLIDDDFIDSSSSHGSCSDNDDSSSSKISAADESYHHCYDKVNRKDNNHRNNSSMFSECFASHDSDVVGFDPLEQVELECFSSDYNDDLENDDGDSKKGAPSNTVVVPMSHKNNEPTNDNSDHHHHQIVLYYNSKTESSTKSLSLVEVRNRLMKNLQFIKDVKTLLGPFLDTNSKHFTIEYCDVADRGMCCNIFLL